MNNAAFALGNGGLIVFLSFLSAFVPISTDLYLPALPSMAKYFGVDPELANLTLSLFIMIFALSMLFWGPFSDKYGRKPILFLGLIIYILSSLGLALCTSIHQLIVGRCFQALGSGAVSSVSMAIVKDTFKDRTMETVLTAIQTMTMLAPMLAPVLGGALLTFTSWRGIFWVLTGCGGLALLGWFALRETLTNPTRGSALASLGRIAYVLRQKDFRALLLVFSVGSMSFMAYLATSSYIYENIFHTTPQQYSYFFAANAAVSILGPLFYLRFLRDLPRHWVIAGGFILTSLAGALLIMFGESGPYTFAMLFVPISVCGSGLRPPTTVLLMTRLDSDNGTVSALIVSVALFFGSLSMLLCSLPWSSFVLAAGAISVGVGVFCAGGWLWLDRDRKFS
ncbi:MAG: multidrug effflux MFS transporter [Candidatus Adiutrix sp.]|jgi:DHA1 family bicyclomycin/chloramphenicol resistance-like MFS transporter|nr:multidrug effflux MFS transporter [Candidatus Adiutrix sp.]